MTGEKKKRNREKKRRRPNGNFRCQNKKNRANTKNTSKYAVGDGGWVLDSGADPLFVEIRWGSRPALNPNGRYTQLYSVLCIPGGDTYHDLVGDQVICI